MQSRKGSLLEAISGTAVGFITSVLIWEFIVKPVWGLTTSFAENLSITCVFTVASILRSYWWRRLCNWLTNKNKKEANDHRTIGIPDQRLTAADHPF